MLASGCQSVMRVRTSARTFFLTDRRFSLSALVSKTCTGKPASALHASIWQSLSVSGCLQSINSTRPRSDCADAQVFREVILPLVFHRHGYFCVAIARQVHQAAIFAKIKEIDLLGSPWCFTGASQAALGGNAVQGAGLAGIGTPGKSHFGTAVGGCADGFRGRW